MTRNEELVASYDVTPGQLKDHIKDFAVMNEPVMIWGPPGIGKSTASQEAAAELGFNYVPVWVLLLDPVDLHGLPWRDTTTNVQRWAIPAFLPPSASEERWLINLEELPAAPGPVQTALYSLVWDRQMGEYRLPEGATIVATGNRQTDGGIFHKMSPALASRFACHFDVAANAREWGHWAVEHGIAPEVSFFMQFRDELLHAYDAKSKEHAFPSPRSWERVSHYLKRHGTGNLENERAIYRGMIGAGAAAEFVAFLRTWRSLPHPRVIFTDPEGAEIPSESSVLLALCGAMCRAVDDSTMDALCVFAQRLRPEIGEFLVGQTVKRQPKLQHTIAYTKWAALTA